MRGKGKGGLSSQLHRCILDLFAIFQKSSTLCVLLPNFGSTRYQSTACTYPTEAPAFGLCITSGTTRGSSSKRIGNLKFFDIWIRFIIRYQQNWGKALKLSRKQHVFERNKNRKQIWSITGTLPYKVLHLTRAQRSDKEIMVFSLESVYVTFSKGYGVILEPILHGALNERLISCVLSSRKRLRRNTNLELHRSLIKFFYIVI